MALDTRSRRASSLGVASPAARAWPAPSGSLASRALREHLAYCYALASAGPPPEPTVTPPITNARLRFTHAHQVALDL